jgi:hypothetical protein
MNDHNLRLRQLTDDLLSLDHPGQLRDASIELHALCSELAGLSDGTVDPLDTTPTLLAAGLAISPLGAARCTLDFARTAQFLRGTHRALNVALERFSARPLEILYAGCGPFATLAIPLMTRFSAHEVRFTLLDIHQRSLDAARRLVRSFGFEAWVREFVEADATAYRHPALHPLHIIVTETMQRALTKEPQVAVTLNLAPQLCPGGILIPERISVDACLHNPATEFRLIPPGESTPALERVRVTLGRLLDLSLASVPRWRSEGLPEVSVAWPEAGSAGLQLMLRTQVTVFESFTLGDYDAGITCPHHDREFHRLEPGSTQTFRYQMGEEPGFRMRLAV